MTTPDEVQQLLEAARRVPENDARLVAEASQRLRSDAEFRARVAISLQVVTRAFELMTGAPMTRAETLAAALAAQMALVVAEQVP